jgi:hypothetical protein
MLTCTKSGSRVPEARRPCGIAGLQPMTSGHHTFDTAGWFRREPVGRTAQLLESCCLICRLPVGATTQQHARDVVEVSHLTIQHPHGVLRWFLRLHQFPPT